MSTLLYLKSDRPTFRDLYNVIMRLRKKGLMLTMEMQQVLKDEQAIKESMEFIQRLPSDAFAAALNKLQAFATSPLLRGTFSRRKSTVRMEELLEDGKLVIWRFSKADLPG